MTGDVTSGQRPTNSPQLVLGWDLQPTSSSALRCAVDLATRLGAHLHVVHVADAEDLPVDPDACDWEEQLDQRLADVETTARSLLDGMDTTWTYHDTRGRPSDALAELAESTDALMIVVGAQRGGMHCFLESLAGESVSRQLTHRHGRPVLVVPEPRGTRQA